MSGINEWISSIVFYLLFTAVIINLLPSGKYEKYLRLFAGCVLILLVLGPAAKGFGLEEKINSAFRSISFENEIGEFAKDLEEMERKRLDRLIGQYEEETQEELMRLAEKKGLTVQSVHVWLVRETDRPDFGRIQGIEMEIRETQNAEAENEMQKEQEWKLAEISVEPVKPVTVENSKGAGEKQEGIDRTFTEQPADAPVWKEENSSEIRTLRQEIAKYYQLEERYVEIRLEE